MTVKEVMEKLATFEKSLNAMTETLEQTKTSIPDVSELKENVTLLQKSVETIDTLKTDVETLKEAANKPPEKPDGEDTPEKTIEDLKAKLAAMQNKHAEEIAGVTERITKISKSVGIGNDENNGGGNDEYKAKYEIEPLGAGKQ